MSWRRAAACSMSGLGRMENKERRNEKVPAEEGSAGTFSFVVFFRSLPQKCNQM